MATNPDFSLLYAGLNQLGLNTLFAPTNEAFEGYNTAAGITDLEGASSPLLLAGFQLLIVPEAISVRPLSMHVQMHGCLNACPNAWLYTAPDARLVLALSNA